MWIAEDDEKEENTDIGTSWEMYFKDRLIGAKWYFLKNTERIFSIFHY